MMSKCTVFGLRMPMIYCCKFGYFKDLVGQFSRLVFAKLFINNFSNKSFKIIIDGYSVLQTILSLCLHK